MKKLIILISMIAIVFIAFANPTENYQNPESSGMASVTAQQKKEDKKSVQVVIQETTGLTVSEVAWLPGMVQDRFKSNMQDYLGMKIIVDAKSESALKKLQAESENEGRDENAAIELGKITTAKFALFVKVRKTGTGYVVTIDYTDLTTGEQMASASSKEYSKAEYLYGSTGAVDELTLALSNKLGIVISELNKNLLTNGTSSFSLDDQMALAKQNEEQFKKQMKAYDEELSKLMTSNDITAVQNKNRIEAEKALLAEKQNAEKKRQEELKAQKARAEADAKLEAERSIALKTQRDQMAKEAAAKAAEVRKLKMAKQGVLGQINVIESKKKALVEIRQGVEERSVELYNQMVKDKESEENRIRNKAYSTVECENGVPTQAAKQHRENQVIKSYEDLSNKFFADCESVKQSTMVQQNGLLTEIRSDLESLAATRTVSSMGDELRVSFGPYAGSQNGWNAYLSLYSDGVLLYTDNFIVNYQALSGKKAPDMATELDDAVIEEYANNVDMYNSLLTRGDPIIYFEIDYNVTAESDDYPSQYKFNFNTIRVINTVSGKTTQSSSLSKVQPRTMKPEWDLREIVGIAAEFKRLSEKAYKWEITKIKKYVQSKGFDYNTFVNTYVEEFGNLAEAEKPIAYQEKFKDELSHYFVKIPGKNFAMLKTEVTQQLYQSIMGSNPSNNKGSNLPVENVSWYDAIYFCNKLSKKAGLTPVYSVNGTTDVTEWNYTPHYGKSISENIIQNTSANGYRLPTQAERKYAAAGGQTCAYAGSNNIDEVAWYRDNSGKHTHPVAQKEANGYGLYDMSGNVMEWCYDSRDGDYRYKRGGSYNSDSLKCLVYNEYFDYANYCRDDLGFRIVCSAY